MITCCDVEESHLNGGGWSNAWTCQAAPKQEDPQAGLHLQKGTRAPQALRRNDSFMGIFEGCLKKKITVCICLGISTCFFVVEGSTHTLRSFSGFLFSAAFGIERLRTNCHIASSHGL